MAKNVWASILVGAIGKSTMEKAAQRQKEEEARRRREEEERRKREEEERRRREEEERRRREEEERRKREEEARRRSEESKRQREAAAARAKENTARLMAQKTDKAASSVSGAVGKRYADTSRTNTDSRNWAHGYTPTASPSTGKSLTSGFGTQSQKGFYDSAFGRTKQGASATTKQDEPKKEENAWKDIFTKSPVSIMMDYAKKQKEKEGREKQNKEDQAALPGQKGSILEGFLPQITGQGEKPKNPYKDQGDGGPFLSEEALAWEQNEQEKKAAEEASKGQEEIETFRTEYTELQNELGKAMQNVPEDVYWDYVQKGRTKATQEKAAGVLNGSGTWGPTLEKKLPMEIENQNQLDYLKGSGQTALYEQAKVVYEKQAGFAERDQNELKDLQDYLRANPTEQAPEESSNVYEAQRTQLEEQLKATQNEKVSGPKAGAERAKRIEAIETQIEQVKFLKEHASNYEQTMGRREEQQTYEAMAGSSEFEAKAARGKQMLTEAMGRTTGVYDPFQEGPDVVTGINLNGLSYASETQKNVFYAIYEEEGFGKATDYLSLIRGEANRKGGEDIAKRIKELDSPFAQRYMLTSTAVGAGLESFVDSMNQVGELARGNTLAVEKGSYNTARGEYRPELTDVDGLWNDVTYSVANTLPSVVAGTINPALGAATMATNAFGSSVNESLREGKPVDEAVTYGAVTGVIEGSLQYVIGGIGKIGGITKTAEKFLTKANSVIENTLKSESGKGLLKTLLKQGVNSAGEFAQESLQAFVEPVLRNLIFDENNEIGLFTEEQLYAGLVGALTSIGVNAMSGEIGSGRSRDANTRNTPKLDAMLGKEAMDGIAGTEAALPVAGRSAGMTGIPAMDRNAGTEAIPAMDKSMGMETTSPVAGRSAGAMETSVTSKSMETETPVLDGLLGKERMDGLKRVRTVDSGRVDGMMEAGKQGAVGMDTANEGGNGYGREEGAGQSNEPYGRKASIYDSGKWGTGESTGKQTGGLDGRTGENQAGGIQAGQGVDQENFGKYGLRHRGQQGTYGRGEDTSSPVGGMVSAEGGRIQKARREKYETFRNGETSEQRVDNARMLEIASRSLPQELQDIAEQNIGRGIETMFVLDDIEFRVDVNGKAMKATARGFAENGKVYIKVNNTFTAEQINGHETFHVEAERYPGEVKILKEAINRVTPKNVMEVVLEDYQRKYGVVYPSARIAELAQEEILADIAGEMNPLSNIPEVREAVGRFYDEIYGKGAGEEFRKRIDSSRYSVNKEKAAGEPAAFSLGREADAADEIMGYFEGENGARSAGEEMSFEAMMEEAARSQREPSQAEADAAASGIMAEMTGEGGRFDSKNEDAIMKEQEIRRRIQSDEFPKTIRKGQQNKHIEGTHEYEQYVQQFKEKGEYGPSRLTIDFQDLLALYEQYRGTGEVAFDMNDNWIPNEVIMSDRIIGVAVNNLTGQEIQTTVFKIHYSKKGIHIVPDYPSKKGK